jgi:predicted Zn-dependent protease
MRGWVAAVLAAVALSGCVTVTTAPTRPVPQAPAPAPGPGPGAQAPTPDRVQGATAAANFRAAVGRVEPVAEAMCRAQRGPRTNCDFLILVHPDPRLPVNAYQSLDRRGRPVLTFTRALIADARNEDEIAFVIGHEAAHHIEGHLDRQRESATAGAVIGGLIATAAGADRATVDQIARAGANVGARTYSREHELEADALGTVITHRAGYDPLRGAEYFFRIPDPGDRFLGTHPPNAQRLAIVRRVAASL